MSELYANYSSATSVGKAIKELIQKEDSVVSDEQVGTFAFEVDAELQRTLGKTKTLESIIEGVKKARDSSVINTKKARTYLTDPVDLELFTDAVTALIEEVEFTPPAWLAAFSENFNNQ